MVLVTLLQEEKIACFLHRYARVAPLPARTTRWFGHFSKKDDSD
jgi:hypothetical protein